ncbi:MAG: hypothetical protein WB709_08635 [Solirubrobacteraceae bacterium]
MSLAVEIAETLDADQFELLRQLIHDRAHAATENFRSEMFGRLLGGDAEQRMEDFLQAACDIRGLASQSA